MTATDISRRNGNRYGGRRIVVLGAGYAGLSAALRLAPHHRVVLVAPGGDFTERIRLHELAAGGRESVGHPLSRLLAGTGIRHVPARATALDPATREVTTDGGDVLGYDRLVYALGSRTRTPGDAAGDVRVHTPETAAALHARLRGGPGRLTVVGGGLTGIETAAEIAQRHPDWRVRLVTAGELGGGLSGPGRAHVRAVLTELGVSVTEGRRLSSVAEADADAVVWAASTVPNTRLAADAGLAVEEGTGQLRVDAALRSVTHPEILVAGDAAAGLRMSCATAMPTGVRAAETVLAEARGARPRPLRFRYLGQCVSLGRDDGLVQFTRSDDSPRERIVTGRRAAWIKEQVVRSTVGQLRFAARRPGLARRVLTFG
ncbi:FAD-dependent oxidoreductase [Streptomyces sp. TRM 70361]|uniref:NAD(P)/FAD-dependent oxidoreductase n=1 Tax=Streptomyces sp. TRM 70361 TaxID=3116553 RepID=UPI002E7BEC00|nr:FAD-dependent oxidoreductase [Streptomyces sp. TRM 70361]MEE1940697.1 FAD-dependent oxidoreductase [Streptomyces sp. TRM 70361]